MDGRLASKLATWIFIIGGLAVSAVALYSNLLSGRMVIAAAEREAEGELDAAINEIDGIRRAVERETQVRADVLAGSDLTEEQLGEVLAASVSHRSEIFGAAVAFAPYAYSPLREHVAVYRFIKGDGVGTADLAAPGYRYWEKGWYTAPVGKGEAAWTEPYFDEGGGATWMITYSVPVLRLDTRGRRLVAVTTSDLTLEWLHEIVDQIRVGESGYGVVLTRDGQIISHPDRALVLQRVSPGDDRLRPEAAAIVNQMMAGHRGFAPIHDAYLDRQVRAVFGPIPGTDWSLAVMYPDDELMGEPRRLFAIQLLLLGLGMLLLASITWAVTRHLTRPLVALTRSAAAIGAGNLDTPLPEVASRDEVGHLAGSFRSMRDALKGYIRDLEETTRARERFETELRTARRVQEAMLPQGEARGAGYEMAASITPARSIGGDLFSHFERDGRFFFIVADVSGKGIPAALFMARTKTMFEAAALERDDPAEILGELNRGLLRDNQAGMFVTALCGSLELASGVLTLASAGHDPPLRVDAGGEARQLRLEGGPILGLLPFDTFPEESLPLARGAIVVGFTDGVTEANDKDGAFFGIERAVTALARGRPLTAAAACGLLLDAVRDFARGAEPSDDLTVLALRWDPSP